MSSLLLIDWDDHQVRLLAGSQSGGSLRVDHMAAAAIEGDASPSTIAAALRPLLELGPHGRGNVVLVLGGRDVQSRLLGVPPVPPDELPDLVRLRADTEFSVVDDAAVIDYLPVESTDSSPTTILAARMSAKTLAAARDVCSKLQIAPESIAMRGCGVAELMKEHSQQPNSRVGLIVVRRGSELDLVGTSDGTAAVVRTVPLAADIEADALAATAAREIRRTMAAISSELNSKSVDSLFWVVGDKVDGLVAQRCSEELSRPVTPIELASLVTTDLPWPAGSAAFAGMVGTGVALANRRLAIDFLAPRKPPEKRTPTTTYALAAVLAALVLLGGSGLLYRNVAAIEKAAAVNIAEREGIEAQIEQLAKEVQESQDVKQWLATDVNWLDELDRIAVALRPVPLDNHQEFQPDRDVRLTSLVTSKAPGRRGIGGTVELAGAVRDDAVLEAIEDQLRGPGRQVNPKTLIHDSQSAPYVWTFQNEIVVTPEMEDRQ